MTALYAESQHTQPWLIAIAISFRPNLMTTLCAMMGAAPMAPGIGTGAELRQPLGIVVVVRTT